MNTDYSDFITRHHKPRAASHKPAPHNGFQIAVFISIFSLYLLAMIILVSLARVDMTIIVISVLVFLVASLVAYAAKRAQFYQARQERELILLKEVLEGSRGGRLVSDSADNILYFNQRFFELCITAAERPMLNDLVQMFSANDKAAGLFRALSDKAHRGLTDSIELYSGQKDHEGWYQITAQPVPGHAGFIHWRIDNVTERYTADRSEREEREKLIDFTDNAPVGFFSVDENGRFIFANATLARWLGEDLNKLLSQGMLHTYLDYPPRNAKPYDLKENGGAKQLVELRMKGAGGQTFLASINQSVVFEDGGAVRTRAVVHDLTTEREMHHALLASEDRFKRFYEEAPLGIVLVDKDGKIEDCNSAFARMMGKTVSELEDKHFKLLIGDEHREAVLEAMKHTGQGEQMAAPMDVSLNTGQGKITAQLHARRFREGESIVLHFIDTTEKKALEAQFVQSQKMQAVGQLAGGIAHDFNNLLTAIIGFCDLLLLRHKPGDSSFSDIMQIKQNSNRAANLVRQLLAFSRQQTLRQRVHDMTDILTELSHLLRRLLGANIKLEMVHGSDLGFVKVDEGQMEQVLVNLAVNARDAMEHGGTLTIKTQNFSNRKPKLINREEMPVGHWILTQVIDAGCGIPQENMARIFEPFFTTKGVGQGTGLGLATVYGIIRQSGGYLDVESVVGKGTTFSIYLPRTNETAQEDEAPAQIESVARDLTGTECILLVEDEDAVRTFSQRALVNKGYEVLTAAHGEDALTVFAEQGRRIDLLITDVVMPGMDGATLAKKIREQNADLKIIFISGYTEDKLKDHMGEGIYFLPKPFTLKQLAEKVKEVLGG